MNKRAAHLITALKLERHPEGGHFREIHRSPHRVEPSDGRGRRAALTVIHFLLTAGEWSRWHRVSSDEVWHYLEGDVLELSEAEFDVDDPRTIQLGPAEPIHVIPANAWQRARTTGEYTLVACTVGPGFDFADFEVQ